MKPLKSLHVYFLSLFVFLSVCLHSQVENYAIKNVTIIPMNRNITLPNHTILISKGKIENLGSAEKIKIPEGYTTIDATGKYIIPGFFDMHTHFLYEQGAHVNTSDKELKLMLANGVTTARIMAGHTAYLEARENVRNGKWKEAPELFVASPQLAGQWPFPTDFKNYELVTTKEQAIAAVKKFKNDGYDEIKITFKVNREVYDAIIEAAKQEHIKVTGHVGPIVKLPAALAARQQIEHMDEFIEMLLPDTTYNHGQSVSDFNVYSKNAWATVRHLDESKIVSLAQAVKKTGIYVTPTNYFLISSFAEPMNEKQAEAMPDYNYIPAALKQEKKDYRASYLNKLPSEEDRKKYVRIRHKMVYELWKAGVPLMAGSDAPEFFIVTGISLHKELEEMVRAGLTTFAALETATINPATYLGVSQQKGTIEAGKRADLILLNKNPLTDIKNTSSISGVFKNGSYFDSERIAGMLNDARKLGN